MLLTSAPSTPFIPHSLSLPLAATERVIWPALPGSAMGLAIATAAQQTRGFVMVLTADVPTAMRLHTEIAFYLDSKQNIPLLHLPDWETLPYDNFSPHQDIISQRLETLYHLPTLRQGVLIVPIATAMHRLAPRAWLEGSALILQAGERLEVESFRRRLEAGGYRCVSQVMEHGEFAVRGSLIDLFPMGSTAPYRIDLLDEEIDTLRTFDPETQRSLEKTRAIRLLPAREVPLTKEAIGHFRLSFRAQFEGDPQYSHVYRDISAGLCPAGIEYYLPLFFSTTSTLFDYLPRDAILVTPDNLETVALEFWHAATQRYEQLRHDLERPLLPPQQVFLQANEVLAAVKRARRIVTTENAGDTIHPPALPPPSLPIDHRAAAPLHALQKFLAHHSGPTLFVAESAGRREGLLNLLKTAGLEPQLVTDWHAFAQDNIPLGILVAPLEQGLLLTTPPLAVITEPQLFGEHVMQRRRRKSARRDSENIVRNLAELHIGDPVVHEQHGVGRYLGLQVLTVDGMQAEYLTLAYDGDDKLYVPVAALHLISRYTGAAPENAPLHRLGGDQWQKARRKAAEKVRDVAAELLEIYARRQARQGRAFPAPDEEYRLFAAGFPFEETADQSAAIADVIADMVSTKPMDRLVCGDVGFGKTEVAMRAVFLAVHGGAQVAVLVPTTLLAQQHYQNFKDRYADWPFRIEVLSRFRAKKEQDEVLEAMAAGRVDILIGTHKLLQSDIKFKNLGLVVIDEEHRFGVRQKERFKALRAEVDVLTLTATPIPRTLNLALSKLRDLSIIATPPSRRLAVKTFVREWQDGLIQEACLREIRRGGQVYFLHNEVETIDKMAATLEKLLPEARVRIAHGQMHERDLERVMSDFYHQRFNILVCTTIIETGIDVPSANTIIIHRADKLGLAQLYQLRGRVGRSYHRAYAYLITPPRSLMKADAEKRLDAIAAIEELGAGFTLATHDLEIRGAGEILGEEQSGQIQEVGYTFYTELLERAVRALQQGVEVDIAAPASVTEVELHIPALIPEDYLPDVHTRLMLYKRIAVAKTDEDLRELQVEMIDRFGLLPPAVKHLFQLTSIKLQAEQLGIRKLEAGPQGGRVVFLPQPRLDPARLIHLLQSQPRLYKLDGQDKLRFVLPLPDATARVDFTMGLLQALA